MAIHRFIKLLLHTAAAPCVAPRPACGEEPSSESVTDALQGTWVFVSTEERGEAKKYSNRSMVFEKNEYRFFVKALLVRKAVVTVNVVAKPYTMDLFQQIGSTQGHVGNVVTTDTANWTVLHCSGPTPRRGRNLIRQVGGALSSGAVTSTADESSWNQEVIRASA